MEIVKYVKVIVPRR